MTASDHLSAQWRTQDGDTPKPEPEQLPMFMSGRDITSRYKPHSGDISPDDKSKSYGKKPSDVMMARKLAESKDNGRAPARELEKQYGRQPHMIDTAGTDELSTYGKQIRDGVPSTYDSIKAEGVKQPVNLYSGDARSGKPKSMGQGHHRVAAQTDIDADRLIPVLHHSDQWNAITSDGYGPPRYRPGHT